MIFKKKLRKFKPSKYSEIVLKDCGKIILNDNEQVTFSDKYKKNRQAKGEKNGQSLLTANQVIEARKKYKPRIVTYEILAKEYGVCKDTMQKAIRGIYWRHL